MTDFYFTLLCGVSEGFYLFEASFPPKKTHFPPPHLPPTPYSIGTKRVKTVLLNSWHFCLLDNTLTYKNNNGTFRVTNKHDKIILFKKFLYQMKVIFLGSYYQTFSNKIVTGNTSFSLRFTFIVNL